MSTEQKAVAISVQNLSKKYKLYEKNSDRLKETFSLTRKCLHKEHFALSDVSLDIYKGETVGIIGTNGSGKSTILKMITGVLSPSSGTITVDGRISALLELGAGFNMEYTGLENIYLNGTMIGFTDREIDEKLPAILEFADIGDFVHQPVKTYSSGMFVRLAFAVAINIEPEILIVDEALSVGDVFFQAKCYRKFEEFKRMGKTILFVSHDLSSIQKYCDRVVLLNKGHKLGEGTPKEMIDLYKQVLTGTYASEELPEHKSLEIMQLTGAEDTASPLVYGNGKAEITSLSILDEGGRENEVIEKGTRFTISEKVLFHERVEAPIFAFSFKDVKGTEITGTNTMLEKAFLQPVEKGETVLVTFTQEMSLQGGEYFLSMGVTGFEQEQFVVYKRLYDVAKITVVSDKDTVGFYDMNSTISVTKEG